MRAKVVQATPYVYNFDQIECYISISRAQSLTIVCNHEPLQVMP